MLYVMLVVFLILALSKTNIIELWRERKYKGGNWMFVYYDNDLWIIDRPPVRERLMPELRDSCPHRKVKIRNVSNNKRKEVQLCELTFQYEH